MPRSKKGGPPKPRSFPRNKSPNKARYYGSSKRSPTRSKRPISNKRFRADNTLKRERERTSTSSQATRHGPFGPPKRAKRSRSKSNLEGSAQVPDVHPLEELRNNESLQYQLGRMIDGYGVSDMLAETDSAPGGSTQVTDVDPLEELRNNESLQYQLGRMIDGYGVSDMLAETDSAHHDPPSLQPVQLRQSNAFDDRTLSNELLGQTDIEREGDDMANADMFNILDRLQRPLR